MLVVLCMAPLLAGQQGSISYTGKGGGTAVCGSLCDDLVSYWAMDETGGTRVDSIAAAGNNLADNNTVGSATGMHNLAANLVAASSQYLSVDSPWDGNSAPFSLSGWIYSDPNQGTDYMWYGCLGTTSSNFFYFYARAGIFYGVYSRGSDSNAVSASGYDGQQWWFVVTGYDTVTDKSFISVNGEPKRWAAASVSHLAFSGSPELWIGRAVDLGYGTFRSDEVAYFSDVLSDTEIAALYNGGTGKFWNGAYFALMSQGRPLRYARNDWLFDSEALT